MSDSKSSFSLSNAFSMVAIALIVDLCFVFPLSHNSIIGTAITKFTSSIIVPPLDWFATKILGISPPSAGYMSDKGGSVPGGTPMDTIPSSEEVSSLLPDAADALAEAPASLPFDSLGELLLAA